MANQNKPRQASNPTQNAANNLKSGATSSTPTRAGSTGSASTSSGNGARKLTPRQEAARKRAQQRRRTQLLVTGAIVVVVAAALIILGISLSQPVNFNNIPATITTDAVPFQLGPSDAKVTVEEYGDYQCPYCAQFHSQDQNQFIRDYITSNKGVKFIFKPFPFIDQNKGNRESHTTVEAAYCAADQKRFWDFDNALYDNQKPENSGFWTYDHLKALAKALQLNTSTFNSCLDSNKYKNQASDDATAAQNRGVSGTPTFFVNNQMISYTDYNSLKTAVESAIASSK
jgi:protein-disulfide isomerase